MVDSFNTLISYSNTKVKHKKDKIHFALGRLGEIKIQFIFLEKQLGWANFSINEAIDKITNDSERIVDEFPILVTDNFKEIVAALFRGVEGQEVLSSHNSDKKLFGNDGRVRMYVKKIELFDGIDSVDTLLDSLYSYKELIDLDIFDSSESEDLLKKEEIQKELSKNFYNITFDVIKSGVREKLKKGLLYSVAKKISDKIIDKMPSVKRSQFYSEFDKKVILEAKNGNLSHVIGDKNNLYEKNKKVKKDDEALKQLWLDLLEIDRELNDLIDQEKRAAEQFMIDHVAYI